MQTDFCAALLHKNDIYSRIPSFNLCSVSSFAGKLLIIPTSLRSRPTLSVALPTTCWQCKISARAMGTQTAQQMPRSAAGLDRMHYNQSKHQSSCWTGTSSYFEYYVTLSMRHHSKLPNDGLRCLVLKSGFWRSCWVKQPTRACETSYCCTAKQK